MSEQPNQMSNDAPWAAKSLLTIGMNFGVPTLILAFLLAREAGWVPNPVVEELQEIKGHIVQNNAMNQELTKALREQNQQKQMQCVLHAKTNAEKLDCFPKAE